MGKPMEVFTRKRSWQKPERWPALQLNLPYGKGHLAHVHCLNLLD